MKYLITYVLIIFVVISSAVYFKKSDDNPANAGYEFKSLDFSTSNNVERQIPAGAREYKSDKYNFPYYTQKGQR